MGKVCLPWMFASANQEGNRVGGGEGEAEELQHQLDSLVEPLTYDGHHCCLLAGPPRSGKSSLAFRYAYNVAAAAARHKSTSAEDEDGDEAQPSSSSSSSSSARGQVFFVAHRHKLQNQLPLPPPPPYIQDPSVLKRIKMKYVEDDEKLCRFLANLHLLPRLPRLLVIDDLGSFLSEKDVKRTARLMAFIKEAADYASSKRSDFVMLATDTLDVEINPRGLQLCQRWFDMTMLIRGAQNPLRLTVENVRGQADTRAASLYYELSPSYVCFIAAEMDDPHAHP